MAITFSSLVLLVKHATSLHVERSEPPHVLAPDEIEAEVSSVDVMGRGAHEPR